MFIALLIIARTAHIGATILLAGTFTFKLITLGPGGGSDDFHDLQLCLLHLALRSLVAAFLSGLLCLWLEVANMSGFPGILAVFITACLIVVFEMEFGLVFEVHDYLILLQLGVV